MFEEYGEIRWKLGSGPQEYLYIIHILFHPHRYQYKFSSIVVVDNVDSFDLQYINVSINASRLYQYRSRDRPVPFQSHDSLHILSK